MIAKIFRARGASDARNDAERWFARMLNQDCSDSDRAAFETWYAADPGHASAYRDVEQLWADGSEALAIPAVRSAAHTALYGSRYRAPSRRWLVPAAAAAVVLLAAGIVAWHTIAGNVTTAHYATASGKQQTLHLDDGTEVTLDTNTAMTVRLGRGERRVNLLRGRAQFKVRHDLRRPFTVHAEDGTVTDTGTMFQVSVVDHDVNVVLLQGSVSVSTSAGGERHSASLEPGQQVRYDSTGNFGPVRPADLMTAEGWTHGKLFVHDWSLSRLITTMNRYSDTKLELGDPSLRNIRISGAFRAGDQQTLLKILREGWSIHAEQVSDTRIVLSRG